MSGREIVSSSATAGVLLCGVSLVGVGVFVLVYTVVNTNKALRGISGIFKPLTFCAVLVSLGSNSHELRKTT